MTLGVRFEAEIREQPGVWRRIASSRKAEELAESIGRGPVCLVGSGSSLFVAMLGALALRRLGIDAQAVAASEARFDRAAYRDRCVIALSQSGRSADVLDAIEALEPKGLIALTNAADSPLAARAGRTVAIEAGAERAVPATKSVTGMAAIVLWAAAVLAGEPGRAQALEDAAGAVEAWLDGDGWEEAAAEARRLAYRRTVAIVGSGFGVPVAAEIALKMKEASYVHAEGFAAGEFRHGSSAILDPSAAIVGISDESTRAAVERPLDEARRAGALRCAIGAPMSDLPALGPALAGGFAPLGWIVAGQALALFAGRAAHVDGDAPRGLSKFLT